MHRWMSRIRTLLLLTLALLPAAAAQETAERKPPNLLVVILDDVGIDQLALYDDVNGYVGPGASTRTLTCRRSTPLAARGVRFEQFRTMPVCSPTRASVLSGLYPFRHGVGKSVYVENASDALREFAVAPAPVPPLVPELLRDAGYTSAAIGKWHLGLEESEGGSGAGPPAGPSGSITAPAPFAT